MVVLEDFAYLFIGHWMQGQLGEDRKNVGLLVKAFFETFKNKKKQPALILKTSQVGSSYMDRDELIKKIKAIRATVKSNNIPNVYLLHGEFTDEEMNQIYNHSKVKAMVSLTKGEGFGRPLLEFSLTKKPIIASGWSAHTEFLDPDFTVALKGELKPVGPSAVNDWIIKESQWFNVDYGQVGHYLKDVFENYKKYTDGAKRQAYKSKNEFSWDKMFEKVDQILTDCLSLSDLVPTVMDIHHNWIREGSYINCNDDLVKKVIDSWRHIRPTLHYSVSREDVLVGHSGSQLPDHSALIAPPGPTGCSCFFSTYFINNE